MVVSRREARERVLELLYEAEMKGATPAEVIRSLAVAPDEWVARYVISVAEDVANLDAEIARRLRDDWDSSRLATIDRLVLRMGVWELTNGDAPRGVVLSEAVSLAKRYGGEQSARFVNGVLAAVGSPPD